MLLLILAFSRSARLSSIAGTCAALSMLLGESGFAQSGMLDPSFRSDLPLRGFVSIVLQNDQKIIAVSDIQASGLRSQQIRRLNGDGSVDETFTSPFGPELKLSAMVCQPDGKLVVAGRFSTNPPVAADEIKRLLPSGALDTNFAASTGTNGWIRSILAQQDG